MSEIIESIEHIPLELDTPAGDLANEIGKKFMKDLYASIDRSAKYKRNKMYFLTAMRKNPNNLKEIHIVIQPVMSKLEYMREHMDFWEFNYLTNKLKVLWSIPHRTEMKNFLRSPEKYSKDLIKWIKQYLEQENINLNDSRSQIVQA